MKLSEVKKPNSDEIISTKEAAAFMGVSYCTLFRMIQGGKIEVVNTAKTGTKPIYGITPQAIQDYYDKVPNTAKGPESINK